MQLQIDHDSTGANLQRLHHCDVGQAPGRQREAGTGHRRGGCGSQLNGDVGPGANTGPVCVTPRQLEVTVSTR